MPVAKILVVLICVSCVIPALAQNLSVSVPMHLKNAKTYYVSGRIAGIEPSEFMVDTGSSYTTINEATLGRLQADGETQYLRDLVAILANGHEVVVPLYQVSTIEVGGSCILNDVVVAVFPAKTRQILGLSALTKASPFQFSVSPPELRLSNCQARITKQRVSEDTSS